MIYGTTTSSLEKWRGIAHPSRILKQQKKPMFNAQSGASMNKLICTMLGLMAMGLAVAKLPPISEEAAAKAAEAKAKDAWTSKMGLYKLCLSQDKVAAHYRQEKIATAQPAEAVPVCSDPGPYAIASPVVVSPITASPAATPAGLPVATDAAATVKK